MSYLVLARKWRPRRFQDLLGQEHVATTLINAIKASRVGHAYLFAGARGVGKTSAARILSMALNCRGADKPTPEPCGSCETCSRIITGSDLDVQEIDGASNNSVDDVRSLRETVTYRPVGSRYKVYIIDEVHMLTQSAFNALLKTLEEPPPHTKFIFATTEPHRIPITILSRCQRFDFRKIPTTAIAGKLDEILKAEGIRMDPEAVAVVAKEAGGSMRDSLSLLDQLIAAFGAEIKTKDVLYLLGVVSSEVNLKLTKAVLDRDARQCLEIITELDCEGYNLLKFAEGYLEHLRDLIVVKAAGMEAPGLRLAKWEVEEIERLVKDVEMPELYRMFTTISKALESALYTPMPKVLFETVFIKLARQEPLATIEKVLVRLGELKRSGLAVGTASQGQATAGATAAPPPMAGRHLKASERTAPLSYASAAEDSPRQGGERGERTEEGEGKEGNEEERRGAWHRIGLKADPSSRKETWAKVVSEVAAAHSLLADILENPAVLLSFDRKQVRIGLPTDGFEYEFVKRKDSLEAIRRAIEKVHGTSPEVVVEPNCQAAVEAKRREEESYSEKRAILEREARSHPVVSETLRVLGGEIVDIKTDVE